MNRHQLKTFLEENFIDKESYSLRGYAEERYCLEFSFFQMLLGGKKWSVYYAERSNKNDLMKFASEEDACKYLAELLINDPTTKIRLATKKDFIEEVGIDSVGRLYVKPMTQRFPYIYRAACGVSWDEAKGRLYSPKPDEWSYGQWFRHIIDAVGIEYGYTLLLSEKTNWVNVTESMVKETDNNPAELP